MDMVQLKKLASNTKDLWELAERIGFSDKVELAAGMIRHQKEKGHYPYQRICTTHSGPVAGYIDPYTGSERQMVYFGSNDYLNLTNHPRTKQAAINAIMEHGVGAGSVPILGGTFSVQKKAEEKISAFKSCEGAMIHSSGYGSNCGTIPAILGPGDCAVADTLVHASLADGCRQTTVEYFKHNDMDSLEDTLKKCRGKYRTVMVIVDGVYSMDGDIARLDEIIGLCGKYGALSMVDDAHATGVIGKTGRGTAEHCGVEGKVDIVAGTFSKAIGVVGGFIGANLKIIDYLKFTTRSYMFSTAIAPPASAAIVEAINIIEEEPGLLVKLWDNIRYLKENLAGLGFDTGKTESAIVPLLICDSEKVNEITRFLHERDIFVNAVAFPAVSSKMSRVRISMTAAHEKEHIDRLLNTLEDAVRTLDV